jgi:hypothetical protein
MKNALVQERPTPASLTIMERSKERASSWALTPQSARTQKGSSLLVQKLLADLGRASNTKLIDPSDEKQFRKEELS